MMESSNTKNDSTKSVYRLQVRIEGSLIDFETTGIPLKDASHEILTLGYLSGAELVVIQRLSREKTAFYSHVRDVILNLPRPFYSYNAEFERQIMRIELGMDVKDDEFVDIMTPWKRKAEEEGLKWPRLDELVSEPEDYFEETKVTGKLVPALWGLFLSAPNRESPLRKIMEHCMSDVLREATLLLRYPS